MPIFNLLILPVVGGYFLLTKCEQFKYTQQRVERQRLIFDSIIKGIYLWFASWILTSLIKYVFPAFVEEIVNLYPVQQHYLGTSICSFLLAIVYTVIANGIIKKDAAVSQAIRSIGNEFELLIESCYREADYVQLTLKNDKSYVGWVKALPIPQYSNYVLVLPVYSGYRDRDTRKIEFTTHYLDVYASYVRDGGIKDINEITDLVIKIDDIVSANRFDDETYRRFNSPSDKQ